MNEHSTDPPENEMSDDILQRAIASIEAEAVPPGPSPQQIEATLQALRYPFRSREVTDVCKHLTRDESRRLIAYSRKVGLVYGGVLGVLMYPLIYLVTWMCTPLYPPRPAFLTPFIIAIPLCVLIAWLGGAGIRKKQCWMLCETDYAKRMGITPDTLPLYDFTGNKAVFLIPCIPAAVLLGILFLLPFGLNRPNYGDPLAGKIIDRMARVYANCKSYQDSGVVTTRYLTDTGDRATAKPFATAFVRSDRFRLESQEDDGSTRPVRVIVWANWKDVRPWWNFWSNRCDIQTWRDIRPGIEKSKSFDLAVAGQRPDGVPKLLLRGEVQFQKLTQLTEAKLAEDGQLDGVECFRVEGKYGNSPLTLWVDKKSYLVRRIDERLAVHGADGKDFRVEVTTAYHPIIDEKVADKLLEFDPPVSAPELPAKPVAKANAIGDPQNASKPNVPSTKQIVDRMVKTYAQCKSYRDAGVVTTLFVMASRNRTTKNPFTTAFVRPDRFRFASEKNDGSTRPSRYIVWCNGKEVQTWWDVRPGIEKPGSLDRTGADGVSGGGSFNVIPPLLMPDKLRGVLTRLAASKRAEDDMLDKVECFRIESANGNRAITVWIDKKSYLVRRVDDRYEVRPSKGERFRVEATTTYDPVIDEKIANKLLDFDPPTAK
jgi:outer membrane lipoprotein-sorting protein